MATKNGHSVINLTYEEIKTLCRESRPPVVTTRDLIEEFDISQQAAYYRLEKLEERGEMERKSVGASGNVWWLSSMFDN